MSDIHERIADWDLDRRIHLAISDPGAFLPRGGDYTEAIPSWSGRAVMTVVQRELDATEKRIREQARTTVLEQLGTTHDAINRATASIISNLAVVHASPRELGNAICASIIDPILISVSDQIVKRDTEIEQLRHALAEARTVTAFENHRARSVVVPGRDYLLASYAKILAALGQPGAQP